MSLLHYLFMLLEQVDDCEYYPDNEHEYGWAKNTCECCLTYHAEETIAFHNLVTGFAVHHVLCYWGIVIHNSFVFYEMLLLVVFLVFFNVRALLRICSYNEDYAENKPKYRTGGIVSSRDCSNCTKGTKDDGDNSECFHDMSFDFLIFSRKDSCRHSYDN